MPRILAFALVLVFLPFAALAQFATLVADTVSISADGSTLSATGNVEIHSGERRLRAAGLTYNDETGELTVIGPVTIVDESGSLIVGENAELTSDLRRGIVRGVRFLLDENTQIAAAELHRVDGRYLQLVKAVSSSCNVCEERPTPLWSISAKRVIHDQVRRQLYFHHARFEIAGVPVFYFHRLRLPDPTLDRATGFLIPKLKTSTFLATGVKIPYFITLGDHADLLLTPYLSSRTNTLEARTRQELSFGSLVLNGAVTDDDLTRSNLRSHLFAEGRFFLPQDFRLNLDLELASDDSYLLTYGYSDADRLNSTVEVTRSGREEYASASVAVLESLLDEENFNYRLYQGTATYQRRFWPAAIGGEVRLTFHADGAKTFYDEPNGSGELVIEKDRSYRTGMQADWLRSWTSSGGLIASARAQLAADARRDRLHEGPLRSFSRLIPSAAVELRWPHIRTGRDHGTDILEPLMQIAWTNPNARRHDAEPVVAEFDEGNLLALSRFQEFDRHERDWRTAIGLGWTRLALNGSEYSVTAGRLFSSGHGDKVVPGSGLSGNGSDWLFSAQVKRDRLTFSTRSLITSKAKFSRFETQFAWKDELTSASGRYIWAPTDISEVILDASRRVHRHWTVSVNGRYDRSADRTTKAGFGLTYRNECLTTDISVSRRYSDSQRISVPASTEITIGVSLGGFGRDGSGPERSCQVRQ